MSDPASEIITLVGKDKVEVKVSRCDAGLSSMVTAALKEDPGAKKVPIAEVEGDTLKLIVEYLERQQGTAPIEIKKPLRSSIMRELVDPEDAAYIDAMPRQDLFHVVNAANVMGIEPLFQLGCAKVASLVKGKAPAEIRSALLEEEQVEHKTE